MARGERVQPLPAPLQGAAHRGAPARSGGEEGETMTLNPECVIK
jgi:hypothetical protein